jgi:subtilisin family serine protease
MIFSRRSNLAARKLTMWRYWLFGWLLLGTLGMLSTGSVGAPLPAATIKVVIELNDEPAAALYATTQQLHLSAATAAQISQAQIARIEAAQQDLLAALKLFNATILYRTQRVYNGIATIVETSNLATIRQLPGVKAVHPLISKSLDNWHSVPLIGAPQVWEAAGLTGEGVTIGIIDSGIDYLHADFGGPAISVAYAANDTIVITDTYNGQPLFPTAKVVGGWDFVGDDYTGGGGSPASWSSSIPEPDPDPAPCYANSNTANHGTHVAGTAAGFGVNADGSTYTGMYRANLNFDDLKIGPGVAPQARLYSLRVFGCNGDSDVVDQAIEWAADPNHDGDFSDHLDVINMSLGSPYGAEEDSTAVAANNAALMGVIVVAAAGNNGDEYYIVNTPGSATRAISVAGSDDGAVTLDGFRVISPTSSAGVYGGFQSTLYDWLTTTLPITGQLVYPEIGDTMGQDQRSGCYTFNVTNTQIISGNIVLLNWTEPSCGSSVTRVGKAAAAGARGVLLVDSLDLFHLIIGGGSLIPAYGVPKDAGETLKATLAVTDVSVVLTAEYQGTVKRLEPFGENAIYTSSARGPRRGDSLLKPDLTAPGVTIYSALNHSSTGGFALSGTSMATPHVAGMMALLRQLHPAWPVADLKALAMNTATTDITWGTQKYDPGRVGAGRVTVTNAAASPAIAYNADMPYAVSVSFGAIEVTSTLSLPRQIRVDNKSARTLAYSITYTGYADVPGVTYTIVPTSILLLPFDATNISVTLQANAEEMKHSRAPTVSGRGGRAWLSEASGEVSLTPSFRYNVFLPIVMKGSSSNQAATILSPTTPALRVPVYAALRPASVMQAISSTLDFNSITTTNLSLVGQGLNTGSQYPTDTVSLVSAFELAEISPLTSLLHPAADLHYLGAGNNFGATGAVTAATLFFAVATYGNWSMPLAPEVQFKVFIDTDRNGTDDFVLTNDTLNGQANDVFYSRLINLSDNTSSYPLPINYLPADTYDTVLFNTNVMILAVPANLLGLSDANLRFNYRVETYAAGLPVDASATHTYSAARAGLDFSGGLLGAVLWTDLPNTTIPIKFNADAYAVNGSIGALLLHHHNNAINRTQTITINP